MRMYLLCLFWLAVMLAVAPDVAAEETGKRIALVIGNGQYEAAGTLPNAVNDARQFGAFLSARGFDADVVIDADRRHLAEAMSRFVGKINTNDVALFYFAGHGMQLRGENYLVGTDARLASEFDVAAETLALTDVIAAVEKKAKIALFFLDACRNNPLANRLNQEVEGATRSIATRGLAPVETESAGTMVAFAAAPGQVASDGSGKNSPFTTALIGHLASPGLEIGTAFKRVIRDVRKATDGKQSPQILSSLALEFYFDPSLPKEEQIQERAPSATSAIDLKTMEIEADFRKALRVNTPRFWGLFLKKHQTGEQAILARQMLNQLQPAPAKRSGTNAETREAGLGLSKPQRHDIQVALIGRGFAIGEPDGAFGQQTRRALADYQASIGIPKSGYFDEETAKSLGMTVQPYWNGLYSSPQARVYNPKDFEGIETDPRVLKAVACNPYFERTYGSFNGHLYVLMRAGIINRQSAAAISKRCGGYLATITSEAENSFVASLLNKDPRLFLMGYDALGGVSYKMGAWIGLIQDPAGKEPRGGWKWENGEPMTYSKWFRDMPNENKRGDDYGMYYAHKQGKADTETQYVDTWDDMGQSDGTYSFVMELE
ncbi:caspase family protein [Rhizobium sp. PL01]|uniref:caspase family protein n=1 Tax=Rhizobium sp. PL01 TaxID=3085631 RepID=UPI002981FB8B|nr:caspase family protein [Rhizobium sp. PL01]MDW5314325.1 caspase family protein [Rhizobium sp. PL01]